MELDNSNLHFLEGDQASLTKLILKRLNPAGWPFRADDLPCGAALVGGSLRDALLNTLRHKLDLDFIVPSNAIYFAQKLATKHGGTCVVLDSKRDIARVLIKDWSIDIARQVGNTLEKDLSRRDFTINSIALTFGSTIQIVDPNGGIQDLRKKLLIEVLQKNLIEDPLRLLRGFRLSAELNLSLHEKTIKFITENVDSLQTVASERIKAELERLVNGICADEVIPLVKKTRLLGPWEPDINNPNTQALSLKNISSLTAKEQAIAAPLIRLTNLLSDQGLKDLGFSKKQIKECHLLRFWYKELNTIKLKNLQESQRIKLHKDLESILPALIIQLPEGQQKIWLDRWRNSTDPLFHPCSPLNGYTLKEMFKVAEGPWIGELMNFLCQEKAFSRLQNRQDAMEAAFAWWKQNQHFYD